MSTTLWASEGEKEEEEEERRRKRGREEEEERKKRKRGGGRGGGEEKVEGGKGRHERDSLYNSVKLSKTQYIYLRTL